MGSRRPKPPPLTDDRGRPAALLDWEALDRSDPQQAALKRGVESVVGDPTVDARTLLPGFGGCLVKGGAATGIGLAVYSTATWAGLPTSASTWGFLAIMVLAAILRQPIDRGIDRVVQRVVGRRRAAEIARQSLEHSVCPSCGYALRGLEREDDGCVVCPECGAAWHADRMPAGATET